MKDKKDEVEFVTDLDSPNVYRISYRDGLRLERQLIGKFALDGVGIFGDTYSLGLDEAIS